MPDRFDVYLTNYLISLTEWNSQVPSRSPSDYINYLWYQSTCLLVTPDSPVCVCLFTSLYFRDINMTKPAFRETSSKERNDSRLSKSFICPHLHAWGFWLSLQPSVLLSDERNTSILSGVHRIMHTSLKTECDRMQCLKTSRMHV